MTTGLTDECQRCGGPNARGYSRYCSTQCNIDAQTEDHLLSFTRKLWKGEEVPILKAGEWTWEPTLTVYRLPGTVYRMADEHAAIAQSLYDEGNK